MTSKKISLISQDTVLADLRISIDDIDSALITLLTERFRLTRKIGEFKRDKGLPAIDLEREAKQFAAIKQRAEAIGLNPAFIAKMWRVIIDEVVANHNALKQQKSTHE